MKINIIPTNKLAILCAAVFAAMLAFTHNASALGFYPDPNVVGDVTPGAPADPSDVAGYINFMITLAPGGSGSFSGQTIHRSLNLFGSLPQASANNSYSGTGTSVNLDVNGGGYTYLFAKYDGQNDHSIVWDVAGMSGTVKIPGFGPDGYGLSGWILFRGPNIPDGGTTVMLLGAALGALGMARRYLKR
jgi:hypothetical protein